MAGDLSGHTLRPAQPLRWQMEQRPGTQRVQGQMLESPSWGCSMFMSMPSSRRSSPTHLLEPKAQGFCSARVFLPNAFSSSLSTQCMNRVFQKQQLIARFLELGGNLTGPLLQQIGGIFLCDLNEEQIEKIPPEAIG